MLDLEGVVVRKEFLLELAKRAGVYKLVRREFQIGANGGVDWLSNLESRLRLLRGVPRDLVESVVESLKPSPGAVKLTRLLRERGWVVTIVTGGFDVMESVLKRASLAYHYYYSHKLVFRDGRLWWYKPGYKDKGEVVESLKKRLRPRLTVAVGDGWNDISMFESADIAIGFNVKCGVKPFIDFEATSFKSMWKLLKLL